MEANILSALIVARIPEKQFYLEGIKVVWADPEINNKPVGSPNESPYKTTENLAIVQDVIDNYAIYEAEYLAQKAIDDSNAEIIRQIDILDLKRIRPLVEGDIKYLETYNNQITELRALLK